MSAAASAAMMLQCFFNPPTDGSIPAGSLPVIKMPLTASMAAEVAAMRAPVSNNRFEGEPDGQSEWTFGAAPAPGATSVKLLRVSLAGPGGALPSPYRARYGTVDFSTQVRPVKFVTEWTGYCQLQPANGAPR